jgi:hypothetical protein
VLDDSSTFVGLAYGLYGKALADAKIVNRCTIDKALSHLRQKSCLQMKKGYIHAAFLID